MNIRKPRVIAEDGDILMIDKPSGLIVNRSATVKDQATLQDWIDPIRERLTEGQPSIAKGRSISNGASGASQRASAFYERSGIVHRLDKDTSGVMVVAKTEKAFNELQRQFRDREIEKEYLALVWGPIRERLTEGQPSIAKGRSVSNGVNPKLDISFVVNAPIARNPRKRMKFAVVAAGREAVTNFEVFRRFSDKKTTYTLLKCHPETGRTHQIRVHLTALNHPIVGDKLYSGRKRLRQSKQMVGRMFLHARKIKFSHPGTGNRVSFTSELPKELKEVIKILENF